MTSPTAICIGCGCSDDNPCRSIEGTCFWLRIDYLTGLGVCSHCPGHEARWDFGDRSLWSDPPESSGLLLPGDSDYEATLDVL